jgi:hypothetical protein
MTVHQFLDKYNKDLKDVLIVKDEWVEEVTPVLIRVLSKNNMVLSDEWNLAIMFGRDVLEKGITVICDGDYVVIGSIETILTYIEPIET